MQPQRIAMLAATFIATTTMAAPLPQLKIDKSQTTVSGASSGGYMAVQLHVAYSATFSKGAGVISGGPFNCAEASVLNALGRCLGRAPIPVEALISTTNDWAKAGLIDPVSNLAGSKVYLFAGAKDSVVPQSTSADLQKYYEKFLPAANITFRKDIEVEHAMVTDDFGAPCLTKAMPFINNCSFDLAGAILQHLYGTLKPRSSSIAEGSLIEFDQTPFVNGQGMATTGWAYVPKSCSEGATCRVHVALHGCRQNAADIGQVFVRNAGYNRWAEANNMVVLYPQTSQKATNSCWDWWGYNDANHAKKSSPQMTAIVAMLAHLSSDAAPAKPAPAPATSR